jgi:hypothetical protein
MLNRLPSLQSFVLVLGSSWFCEPVEKLPVFLEPLSGLRVNSRGLLRTVGSDPGMEISSDEESTSSVCSSSSNSRSSSAGASPRPVPSRDCSRPQFASGLLTEKSLPKGDPALASWELRLQGQSYYVHELGRIGEDLQRRGIDCCITMA